MFFTLLCLICRPDKGWVELGRTETITDSLNPRWQTKFTLDYKFEEKQMLRFAILDIDSQFDQKMDDHDNLGHIDCSLGEVSSIVKLGDCILSGGGSSKQGLSAGSEHGWENPDCRRGSCRISRDCAPGL